MSNNSENQKKNSYLHEELGKCHKMRLGKAFYNDLPEDRSTVLLLGVTRIPTSPVPARRPCTLPLDPNLPESPPPPDNFQKSSAQVRRSSFTKRRQFARRASSSVRRRTTDTTESDDLGKCSGECPVETVITPSNCAAACNENASETVMDRSVDSIGTCSLDVEASAELSDWSEASSGGTLRSASLKTPSTEPHLPSYLSLACTVNGYSTTTNYDPDRLARSRDTSPHRFDHDSLTPKSSYSIQNNLLSPPNLVPLPTHIKQKMTDHTLTQQHSHHQQFYRYQKKQETHFAANLFGKETACYDAARLNTFETRKISVNGQSKTEVKEYSSTSTVETKSFIQQRVERLYGPGALAQGFFVTKRQKHQDSESENESSFNTSSTKVENGTGESPMKQSTSSPALPVLRHLRPEFRAQLPIINPRKGAESSMQKSSTLPTLKDETKVNGHAKQIAGSEGANIAQTVITEESGEKDGHYFLKILQNETNRLLKLADAVEIELSNEGLPEEVIGKIRSASGKARLLVSQKMQQFKGLCTNNITQSENEAFPTTNEDLQGFWDMVMLQVDQVDALFREIEALKMNNWQEIKTESKSNNNTNGKTRKVVNRIKPTSPANEEARKKREAQRKQMIEERRKAMKTQSKPLESIEIFVPESS